MPALVLEQPQHSRLGCCHAWPATKEALPGGGLQRQLLMTGWRMAGHVEQCASPAGVQTETPDGPPAGRGARHALV